METELEQKRGLHTVRDDILRVEEFDKMLHQLSGQEELCLDYHYKTTNGEERVQRVHIKCRMIECLLCLEWLFGKRIYEVLCVRRGDIKVDNGYLYCRFTVQKKPQKTSAGVIGTNVTKRINLTHPYAHYVTDYLNILDKKRKTDANTPLFPGRSTGKHIVQRHVELHRKLSDGRTETYFKDYEYDKTVTGIMAPETALKVIKVLNPNAWTHLFRSSLATTMAEHSATEEELLNWFDWERVETAHGYVKRGTKLTERLSDRNY